MTETTHRSGPRIWVLADERRGTANQAIGVAEALGCPYEVKDIRHSALSRLPNALLGASLAGLTAETAAQLAPPWPDLAIASGRRAAAAARWIKRRSGGRAVLVQIMHPGALGADEFDLIAAPRHDRKAGGNVFQIEGAPHGVTEAALAEAGRDWRDRFTEFGRPVIGLILGGATRRRPFGAAEGCVLGREVGRAVRAAGGSLAVTSSRRTGAALDGVLAGLGEERVDPALVHRWGGADENPYLAILALADALVVTGDSVSMLSEAGFSSKPVYLYAPPGFATGKHERLHRDLIEGGFVRRFDGRIEAWTHRPLNSAGDVAAEIRARFATLFA